MAQNMPLRNRSADGRRCIPFLRFDQLCLPNLAVTDASTVLGAPTVMVLK
jgi:hypothetical protein